MMPIDREDISQALKLLEESGLSVAWDLGTIEADTHTIPPFGKGVSVTLHSTEKPVHVHQKDRTLALAMEKAIERLRRRIKGEEGA